MYIEISKPFVYFIMYKFKNCNCNYKRKNRYRKIQNLAHTFIPVQHKVPSTVGNITYFLISSLICFLPRKILFSLREHLLSSCIVIIREERHRFYCVSLVHSSLSYQSTLLYSHLGFVQDILIRYKAKSFTKFSL